MLTPKSTAITLNLLGVVGFDVEAIFVPLAVAIISGPIVVVLQLLRRENSEQHAENGKLLTRVANKVDEVSTKIDGHIGWHEGKEK